MGKKRFSKLIPHAWTSWGFWDYSIPGLFITRPTKKAARQERKRRGRF